MIDLRHENEISNISEELKPLFQFYLAHWTSGGLRAISERLFLRGVRVLHRVELDLLAAERAKVTEEYGEAIGQ